MPLDQPTEHDPVESFRMPLGDHIEELRRCLVRAIIGLAVALVPSLYFGFDLIGLMVAPLLQAMDVFGYTPQTITPDTSAGFFIYVRVSLVAALILAAPWLLWQLWSFIAAGLYPHERGTVYILAPFSTIMTLLAALFAYYVMLPVCVFFFFHFSTGFPVIDATDHGTIISLMERSVDRPAPPSNPDSAGPIQLPILSTDPVNPREGDAWIDQRSLRIELWLGGQVRTIGMMSERAVNPYTHLESYIGFASMLLLGLVVAFQMPVFMLILGWTGLIDPAQIVKMRKYALFTCGVAGAVLTPADPISMFLLWLPLYALFEFGLLLMRIVDPHKNPPEDL